MQSNIAIKLNENQVKFFAELPKYDVLVDSGTWRSGKSFELCLFGIERMKKYPGIREFVGRKTLKSLKETTFLKFIELLTDHYKLFEGRDFSVNRSSNPVITFPNGSTAVFGDLDINTIGKWLSGEYSDILIDEGQEIAKIVMEKIKSRQTQTIIQEMSAVQCEFKKVKDYYVADKIDICKSFVVNGEWLEACKFKDLVNKKYCHKDNKVYFKYDNPKEAKHSLNKNKLLIAMNPPEIADHHWTHATFRNPDTKIPNSKMIYSHIEGNRANIPSTYIEDMRASVDKRTAEIYLNGNWVPLLSKVVYSDYSFPKDVSGNYIEGGNLRYLEIRDGLENYISMDFGWAHPMSIGCWQFNPVFETYYRVYEVVESYVKPEIYCDLLEGKEVRINGIDYQLPITVHNSMIVPLVEAKQRRQESGGKSNLMRMKEILSTREIDFDYHVSNIGIYKGVLSVRNHIKTSGGKRKIFIDPRYCPRFIKDAGAYHYPVDKEGNVTSEMPEKDNITDHTQDETRGLIGWKTPIRNQKLWKK